MCMIFIYIYKLYLYIVHIYYIWVWLSIIFSYDTIPKSVSIGSQGLAGRTDTSNMHDMSEERQAT